MTRENAWVVGLCFITCLGTRSVVAQTQPANSSNPKVTQAIAAVKELCLVGSQYDLRVDAKGNLSLFKLAPGAEGSVSFDVRHGSGAAAIFDDKVRRFADEDIRACIKPYIERIIGAILGGDDVALKSGETPPELSASHPVAQADPATITELSPKCPQLRDTGREPATVAVAGGTTSVSYTSAGWSSAAGGPACHAPGMGMPPFDDVTPCAVLFFGGS